jgi:hypothetical protein
MNFEDFRINTDLIRGLPDSKNVWPIWLGDHYTKGILNINGVVQVLLEHLVTEMKESKDPVATYQEFADVWGKFAEGAKFGDVMYFENTVFRAVPVLGDAVNSRRANSKETE